MTWNPSDWDPNREIKYRETRYVVMCPKRLTCRYNDGKGCQDCEQARTRIVEVNDGIREIEL